MATLDPKDWKMLELAYELLPGQLDGKGTLDEGQRDALAALDDAIYALGAAYFQVAHAFGQHPQYAQRN